MSQNPIVTVEAPPSAGIADPNYTIGLFREQTIPAFDFFSVSAKTMMPRLAETIGELVPQLWAARMAGKLAPIGAMRFFYHGESCASFTLEVGFPVEAGTGANGVGRVRRIEAYRCYSVLYCGGLAHIKKSWDLLKKAFAAKGLTNDGACWEWYLHFEGAEAANNVTLLQMGMK